jgi:hypothetical protein
MRRALLIVLAACYAPTVEPGIPCASNLDCPGAQACNQTVSPPTCGTPPATPDAAPVDGDAGGTLGPWGAPRLVMTPVGLEDDPTLSGDLRELYFNRGQTTIWRIRRETVGGVWSAPEQVPALEPATTPELSGDGMTMYLASSRPGTLGGNDIWVATRDAPGAAWMAPRHVDELSTTADETNPTPSSDQLAILLARRPAPGQAVDLYAAARETAVAPWSPPQQVGELASSSADGDGMVTADLRTVYFYSTRTGEGDLYVATRGSPTGSLGPPQPIAELNTPDFVEQDPWISPDQRHLFFSSDRSGQMAIYESSR